MLFKHECSVQFRFQTFCGQVRATASKSREKMREHVGEYHEAKAKIPTFAVARTLIGVNVLACTDPS